MNRENALRLVQELPPDARVVDVGGGAMPFPRANYVIDALSYDKRETLGKMDVSHEELFTRDTWCQIDLCERRPWPVEDKFFDYATCSHLLEDVRDPIWICSELCRVAKAGYIEVPSRILEQSLGVENPTYAGYYHHRWLITKTSSGLEFRHKPHLLHSIRDAIVTSVGIGRRINDEHATLSFDWSGSFQYREILEFDEAAVARELCDFARKARLLDDLTTSLSRSFKERLKRSIYYWRLRRGRR